MSTNLTMSSAGGRIICKQCQATSKRTRLQCRAPAIKGKNVCRTHGGLSTGPKSEQGRKRCAEAKTIHGNDTRAKRAEHSRKSAELHQLVNLGNAIGLFDGVIKLRGRRTSPTIVHPHEGPNMAFGGITPKQRLAMTALCPLQVPTKKGRITRN